MPRPGFEAGLLRTQRSVLTTRRSRRVTEEVSVNRVTIIGTDLSYEKFLQQIRPTYHTAFLSLYFFMIEHPHRHNRHRPNIGCIDFLSP